MEIRDDSTEHQLPGDGIVVLGTQRRRFRDNYAEPVADDRGAQAVGDAMQQLLEDGFPSLRFPGGLEEEYQRDAAEPHRHYLSASLVPAMVVYAGFVAVDFFVARDVFLLSVLCRLFVLPLMAATFWLPPGARTPQKTRYTVFTWLAILIGVTLSLVACASHDPLARYGQAAVLLVPLYACVAARLPLRYALTACAGHFSVYLLLGLFYPDGPPLAGVLAQAAVLFGASAFTLVASYQLERSERYTYLEQRLAEQRRSEQSDAIRQLESLSTRDGLTGIANRRHFDESFDAEWKRAAVGFNPLSLLIADVDFFKHYNDTLGHPQGDVCLRAVATALRHVAARHGGSAARLGGEEFAILLPAHDIESSGRVADSLCAEVRAMAMPHGSSAVAPWVTVSVGAATAWPTPDDERGCKALLEAADQALYKAKVSGRDRAMHDGPWKPIDVTKSRSAG